MVNWWRSRPPIRRGSPPVPAIIICPECSTRLRVPTKKFGQQAKCPKCGTRITVNRVESVSPDLPDWMTDPPPVALPPAGGWRPPDPPPDRPATPQPEPPPPPSYSYDPPSRS